MEKTATVRAKDLDPAAKRWLGVVLDVPVSDADELTVTLHRPSEDADRRARARERLLAVMHGIGERVKDVPDDEVNAAIDEAMQFVRSHPADAHGR